MIVSWFSAGVSSAVATKLFLEKCPEMRIIYTHIDDQHEDTLRFIHDCEKWFDKKIEILQSPLKSVENACRAAGFVNSPYGASCTRLLKKRVRKEWEIENDEEYMYIWGFDNNEKNRATRIEETTPEHKHVFPLIEKQISKSEAHGILRKAGIKRPVIYDMGLPNGNCIGCLKGGMGYWNFIRKTWPDVFKSRAKMEREIGGRIFKDFYLDELPEDRGRNLKIIVPSCGFTCEAK